MAHDSKSWNQQSWRVAASVCLPPLLSVTATLAQTITGRIDGHVYDSSGGALPGATVTVLNEGTGLTVTFVTDDTGLFTATNLPVDIYNTMNFGAPNVNANDVAFGTINSAQPPRQFQFGVRFDF